LGLTAPTNPIVLGLAATPGSRVIIIILIIISIVIFIIQIIVFSILIIILNLSDSSLSGFGYNVRSKSFGTLLNARPKSLGSGSNVIPKSLGS
jgi:hypothetical protein